MSPRLLLVSGYYGFANAGDEAILAGLVEGLRQLAPQVEPVILSGDPAATEGEHGVRAVPRGLCSLRPLLRHADLFISGGGGLLQDATSWRSPLYYLATLRLARRAGVPVACIGHSVGPLRRRWIRALVRREISRASMVAVRDHASAETLRALGVRRAAEVTADLAFALNPPSPDETARAWEKAGLGGDSRPAVAVCLRRPPGRPGDTLAAALAQAIAPACRELNLRVVLVPMQHPDDTTFAERTAHGMSDPAEIVRTRLTARDLLALTGGFHLVIAMRLHALIFAAISGVAPVAISYDPKIEGMMAEFGLPVTTSAAALDGGALARAIRSAFGNREDIARELSALAPSLHAAALRNIELALSVLP